MPSEEWMDTAKQMEVAFTSVHKQGISKESGVITSMCDMLSEKFPSLHKKVIKVFVRTRTFIRIRFLNKNYKDESVQRAKEKRDRKWLKSSVSEDNSQAAKKAKKS